LNPLFEMTWGSRRMTLGETTRVMGIVNITPDSFSDGGKFFTFESAVSQGLSLAQAGADILDIGGESTRPHSDPVPADEEIRRVVPVIRALSGRIDIPISIDTTKAAVARAAIEAGASIINDVSALRFDPDMASVARESGVPVILMHMLGTPKTMQHAPYYEDVSREIFAFLDSAIHFAQEKGIPKSLLIADPGIGFGKTLIHNLTLIAELRTFHALGVPLLVGPSRKAFIRRLLKGKSDREIRPDMPEVEIGTQAAVAASIMNGAHIIRAHNVKNTRRTALIVDAIVHAPMQPSGGSSIGAAS
jgi:dihydropteroate synthase